MWDVLCSVTVILAGTSYQIVSVLSSVEYSSWAIRPTAYVDDVKGKQNIAVKNEKSSVVKPFVDPKACLPCTCGELGTENRILGGKPTYVSQYPWLAIIMKDSNAHCGASLINNKYVMTAAHCIYDVVNGDDMKKIIVRLLEHDWTNGMETKHIDFEVSRVITHNGYDSDSNDNDMALLRLDTEGVVLGQNTGINTVCLPPTGESFVGHEGVVVGWGATKESGSATNVLREVYVPIMSNEECENTEHYREDITDNMMCAGYPEGQKDACQGDSGGPLHINVNSTYYIIGLVSFGFGCGRPNTPGVYARVNRYLDWVADNTMDACSCSNPRHL